MAVLRRKGNARASAAAGLQPTVDNGITKSFYDLGGENARPFGGASAADDGGKFVAAETGQKIIRFGKGAKLSGEGEKQLVARTVTIGIVDRLEAVEVK